MSAICDRIEAALDPYIEMGLERITLGRGGPALLIADIQAATEAIRREERFGALQQALKVWDGYGGNLSLADVVDQATALAEAARGLLSGGVDQ